MCVYEGDFVCLRGTELVSLLGRDCVCVLERDCVLEKDCVCMLEVCVYRWGTIMDGVIGIVCVCAFAKGGVY